MLIKNGEKKRVQRLYIDSPLIGLINNKMWRYKKGKNHKNPGRFQKSQLSISTEQDQRGN